jgi:predicted transcriptional regulator
MKPPCVIVVKHILPALRVLVVRELIEKYGVRRVDASAKMELTPAAITQYLKGKRGATFIQEILQSEEVIKGVSKLAETLAEGGTSIESAIRQLCEICIRIRSEELICKLHKDELPALKEYKCTICERFT